MPKGKEAKNEMSSKENKEYLIWKRHLLSMHPSYYNIKNVHAEKNGKHVYFMLNHRVAYLCWMNSLRKGYIKKGAFLCHIDWHPDFHYPPLDILEENEKILDYQTEELEEFVKKQAKRNKR